MSYNIKELQDSIPQRGRLDLISRRPARRAEVEFVESIQLSPETGLEGDHYQSSNRNRQVTLIQAEHLEMFSSILGRKVEPGETRRNLVVSGINLLAFKERQFRIGSEVILEMTGHCHPCSRMEENLGPGGYQAMRGHGGITARIIQGGTIRQGDEIVLLQIEEMVSSPQD